LVLADAGRLVRIAVAEAERSLVAGPAEVLAALGDVDLLVGVPADVTQVERRRARSQTDAERVAQPHGEGAAPPRGGRRAVVPRVRAEAGPGVPVDVEDLA